jgi:hypothetical protein
MLTKKRNCNPYTTDEMDSTGFQSSLRMLRQMLPSRSMLGWYTCSSGGGSSSRNV